MIPARMAVQVTADTRNRPLLIIAKQRAAVQLLGDGGRHIKYDSRMRTASDELMNSADVDLAATIGKGGYANREQDQRRRLWNNGH
jgi:hypothetical protein